MNKTTLIQKLKEVQTSNEGKSLTRKLFRTESGIKDSVWEKHWGTFLEFKVAAGLEASKTQRKLQSAITRHAAVDNLKEFSSQKQGWEEAYLKPSTERFQTILTGSDIHDKLCDPFYRRLFINTAFRVKPHKIVLAGDIFDFPEFSKYTKDPREFDVMGAIDWVHQFLADLRGASPESEIIYISGNHEARLLKYIAEQTPAVMPILSDLHGFTVSKLLKLEDYEVNFVSRDSLAVFTESDLKKEIATNYYIAYDAVLFHHFPYAKQWGMAGVNGHHHTHTVDQLFSVQRGPYEWHQLGCGHIRRASYCEAEKWSNGFALIHVDTHKKYSQFEYVDVTGDHAVIGGRWFERLENEILKF